MKEASASKAGIRVSENELMAISIGITKDRKTMILEGGGILQFEKEIGIQKIVDETGKKFPIMQFDSGIHSNSWKIIGWILPKQKSKNNREITIEASDNSGYRLEFKDGIAALFNPEQEMLCEFMFEEQEEKNCWISAEERMPENDEDVLVWFEYFRYGNYERLFQTIGISHTFRGEWSGFVNGSCGWRDLRIIAWQPLPKPYREEMKENGKNE